MVVARSSAKGVGRLSRAETLVRKKTKSKYRALSRKGCTRKVMKILKEEPDDVLLRCLDALETGFFADDDSDDDGKFHHGVTTMADTPKPTIGEVMLDSDVSEDLADRFANC